MIVNNCFKIVCVVWLCTWVSAILRCSLIQQKKPVKYYRVKTCKRYNTSIIARANYNSFTRCLSFAKEKNGLGFNFSPEKPTNNEDDYFVRSCEVLGCPDVDNFTGLVNDTKFDYYTLYGNSETIYNASCIPTVGIFQVNLVTENYTRADNICRTIGGNLAHILSETRTSGLASIVLTHVLDWYKAAYVGLNDMHTEGVFVTPLDEPLNCFKYRAWAPGHPRPRKKHDDCVVIDAEKTWRAVNCEIKMPFICEIAPNPPFWKEFQAFANASCTDYRNRSKSPCDWYSQLHTEDSTTELLNFSPKSDIAAIVMLQKYTSFHSKSVKFSRKI